MACAAVMGQVDHMWRNLSVFLSNFLDYNSLIAFKTLILIKCVLGPTLPVQRTAYL